MDISPFFKMMVDKSASDMFFSVGAPVSVNIEGNMMPLVDTPFAPGSVKEIAYSLMSDDQIAEFEENLEMNFGCSISGIGRFRINVYRQRGEVAMVVRYVKTEVPTMEELGLPAILKDLIMHKRGLILVVGATGSGKTTSMASMIDFRNTTSAVHILTIEDPIEYIFTNKKSIVDQREVGIDTHSYHNALINAMREAPDVIMIGEIRYRETMHHAMSYADSGHLCLATLHANNADQTIDRILNFATPEERQQLLMDLSLNLRGIIGMRLVQGVDGKRVPAVEVLLNTPFVAELIQKGEVDEVKAAMAQGREPNMQTFDQSLYKLAMQKHITREEALKNADSRNDLNLKFRFEGSSE